LPPSVVDTHCTAVGAAVLARNATVLPSLVKALVLIIYCPKQIKEKLVC